MVRNIEINRISRHPNNPRRNLGDLTELAASIKANGILQNLTVVPWFTKITGSITYNDNQETDPLYTVVVGHRRLEAAKQAGLTEVPCVISDMDEKTQIATMLLENIQRNELTLPEQAEGMQLMLDLGDTVIGISEKTGLSESTVRRRVKLMELDQDKLHASVQRGGTLQDYVELDKIKDLDLKNNVLEKIGTSNFQWELKRAMEKEVREANKTALIAVLETFATCVDNADGMRTLQYLNYNDTADNIKKPDETDLDNYFYYIGSYSIQLLKEKVETDSANEINEERRRTQERLAHLNEITKRAFELRLDFVSHYINKQKHTSEAMIFAVKSLMLGDFTDFDVESFAKMLNVEYDEEVDFAFDMIADKFIASPVRVLFAAAYCKSYDSGDAAYYERWTGKYRGNETLDDIYDTLAKFGYEMSDEERSLRYGTHAFLLHDPKPEDAAADDTDL